jgi:hypothetical protein
MRMRYSWDKDKHARTGVGTIISFNVTEPGEAVARSVLIGTANKARDRVLYSGDQALRKTIFGSRGDLA